MQIKLGANGVLVTGRASKDAEMKLVGAKDSPVTQFSIVAGKRADESAIFVEVKAWYRLAEYAEGIRKGDNVLAIGEIEEREYNGKVYKTLVAEYLDYVGSSKKQAQNKPSPAPISTPAAKASTPAQAFTQIDVDDGDLPF